jgi:hypothetical protein
LPGRPHSSTRLPSSASAGVVRTHGPATFPLTGPGSASGLVPIENSRDAARDCGLHATPVHFRGFRRTASDRSVTWPPSLQHQVPGFRFPPASTAILPSRRPFPSRVPGSAPGHVPICDSRDAARDCGLHATPVLFRGLRRTASDRSVAWPPSLQHQAPGFRLPPASSRTLVRRPFPSRVPGSAPGHVPICDSRDAARDCGLHATPVLFSRLSPHGPWTGPSPGRLPSSTRLPGSAFHRR